MWMNLLNSLDQTKNINQYLESVNGKFIYRGQADSNWELEPSLFRHSPADQIYQTHLMDFVLCIGYV